MARYKDCNYGQSKLIPISFSRLILPGSFEYVADMRSFMRSSDVACVAHYLYA